MVAIQNALLPALHTGGSTRLHGLKLADFVSVMDFGAIPNTNTAPAKAANDAAFALAVISSAVSAVAGPKIIIPPGVFYKSTTWLIPRTVMVIGAGQGDWEEISATRLVFPADTDGIWVQSGAEAGGSTTGGQSVFQDFMLSGGGGTTGDGMRVNARIWASRVNVRGFGRDGWHMTNTNEFSLSECQGKHNVRDGFNSSGDDANAGHTIMFDASQNGRWGMYDSSKFPNTHYNPHMNGNILGSVKSETSAHVWVNGYVEITGHYLPEFQDAPVLMGGILAGLPSAPQVTVSGNGVDAQAIARVNGSGVITKIFPTVLGSGYSGTPTVTIAEGSGSGATATAVIVGGKITSYIVTNGGSGYPINSEKTARFYPTGSGGVETGRMHSKYASVSHERVVDVIINHQPEQKLTGLAVGDDFNGFDILGWNETRKCFHTGYRGTTNVSIRYVSNLSTEITGGRSGILNLGSPVFPLGLWLGDAAAARQIKSDSAMPTSGEYARGDFVFNSLPAKDASNMILLGWSRLSTGSAHVAGTDWGRCYVSDVSPAT